MGRTVETTVGAALADDAGVKLGVGEMTVLVRGGVGVDENAGDAERTSEGEGLGEEISACVDAAAVREGAGGCIAIIGVGSANH